MVAARLRVVRIRSAVRLVEQARPVPVVHIADAEIRAGIDMRAAGEHDPVVRLYKIA